jgi:hypothetical protein
MPWRKLWLCLPPTLLALMDHGITLWFQPPEYWAGDYSTAQEANPHAAWLMQRHPLANEVGFAAYLALVCVLTVKLPRRLGQMLSLGVTIGHTWGTTTWLPDRVQGDYWLSIALCAFAAVVVVLSWSAAEERREW